MAADPVLGRLLPAVQECLVSAGARVPGWKAGLEERERFAARVAQVLVEERLATEGRSVPEVAGRLAAMMVGAGLLEPYQSEPGVEEIIVRRGHIQIERHGRIEDVGDLAGDEYFHQVALRVADMGGQAMKASSPFVLVDLPTGARFTAIVPPLSVAGVAINIRCFRRESLQFGRLAEWGTFTPHHPGGYRATPDDPTDASLPPVARYLARCAAGNLATMLVAGPFSSGKTTLLNAISAYFPHSLQLAVAETFSELQLAHPWPLRAVVPASDRDDRVTMRQVVNVLYTRMRPDVVIIGEVVAGEAGEFLRASNLGVRAYTTIHGDTPYDALRRLEMLAQEADVPLMATRELAVRGVQLVVQMQRDSLGRRYIAAIAQVLGIDAGGRYDLRPLYDGGAREGQRVLEELWRQCAA